MTSELKAPEYLSPSSMGTFKQCPQKFKFNKIDLIPDQSNHWAVLGNFVHDIAEELYKTPPEMRTIENAKPISRRMWDEKWGSEANKVIGGFKTTYKLHSISDDDALRRFRILAWDCVVNLWKVENPQEVVPSGLEYELNGEIGGVKLRGFIDRYSQSTDSLLLTVSDYKTGKTPKPHEYDEKFSQLLIYAKLLSNIGIGDVDTLELLYLQKGVRLTKKVSHQDIQQLTETIQQTKSEIDEKCKTGDFEARTSFLCNFCSYKTICPAWRE
jgi:putative RecB family exonuclease